MIPSPWHFALLALAAFRLWKLIADDAILDPPRDWAMQRLDARWELFIVCPWCAGFWLSGIVLAGWTFTLGDVPSGVDQRLVWMGVWFALSGAVGLIAEALKRITGE